MAVSLVDLKNQAEKILAGSEQGAALVESIVTYAELFDGWFERSKDSFGGAKGAQKEELEKLLALHGMVLKLAKEVHGKTDQEIRSLRMRGKQMLKYIDTMPGRVSLRKGKKG